MIIRAKLNDAKRTYRDISVAPSVNLYSLAGYVLDAFDFDLDHCFGFFQSPDIYGKGKDELHYELFADIGEETEEFEGGGVERTLVSDIFISPKQKWWMLFDYGEDWIFELECRDIELMSAKTGVVIKSSGESPQQYNRYRNAV